MSADTQQRSWVWLLLPVFFNIVGGVIAYYILRKNSKVLAKQCLNIGIVLIAVHIISTVIGVAIFDDVLSPFDNMMFDDEMMFDEVAFADCLDSLEESGSTDFGMLKTCVSESLGQTP